MPIRRKPKLINDSELEALLKRFEAGTTVDENQTIHFSHLDSDELERVLPDAFEADPAFSSRQLRYLLREALWTTRKTGPLTIDRLTKEAHRIGKARLSAPVRRYAIWTKFRAKQMAFHPSFRLQWNGVTIESSDVLPPYMRLDDFFLNDFGEVNPREPVFFGYLIARCESRDPESAANLMMDAMNIFMAVFNLYEMWGRWSKGAEQWAEGKLWPGPYHFLFERRRFIGNGNFWYDPNFSAKGWDLFPIDMQEVLRLIPRVRKILRALCNSPLKDIIVHSLRLMQDAMSSRDESYSLLRYWSALEQLYGDPQAKEKNYSRIIQRATFAEPDKIISRWKLGHISRLRNEYVHAGGDNDDLRIMSQHLRMLLSRHINYLLLHAPYVKSHQHWLEIVDLPDDIEILERRKTLIDSRIALIKERDKPKA